MDLFGDGVQDPGADPASDQSGDGDPGANSEDLPGDPGLPDPGTTDKGAVTPLRCSAWTITSLGPVGDTNTTVSGFGGDGRAFGAWIAAARDERGGVHATFMESGTETAYYQLRYLIGDGTDWSSERVDVPDRTSGSDSSSRRTPKAEPTLPFPAPSNCVPEFADRTDCGRCRPWTPRTGFTPRRPSPWRWPPTDRPGSPISTPRTSS